MGLGDLLDDSNDDEDEQEEENPLKSLTKELDEKKGKKDEEKKELETFTFETPMILESVTVRVAYELEDYDDPMVAGFRAARNKAASIEGRLHGWKTGRVELPDDLEEHIKESLEESG